MYFYICLSWVNNSWTGQVSLFYGFLKIFCLNFSIYWYLRKKEWRKKSRLLKLRCIILDMPTEIAFKKFLVWVLGEGKSMIKICWMKFKKFFDMAREMVLSVECSQASMETWRLDSQHQCKNQDFKYTLRPLLRQGRKAGPQSSLVSQSSEWGAGSVRETIFKKMVEIYRGGH